MAASTQPQDDGGLDADGLAALRETIADLTPGEDALIVETSQRRTLPLAVQADPDVHGWDVPFGDPSEWPARVTLPLRSTRDKPYDLVVDTLSAQPRATLATVDDDGGHPKGHPILDVEVVPDVDEWWCGRCGDGPRTHKGVRTHHSRTNAGGHDGEPAVVPRPPTLPDSTGDEDGDDDPDDQDDKADPDEEDDAEYWCERCGFASESEAGVKRHSGQVHDGPPLVSEHPLDEDGLAGDGQDVDELSDDVVEMIDGAPTDEDAADEDDHPDVNPIVDGVPGEDDSATDEDEGGDPEEDAGADGDYSFPRSCGDCGAVCDDRLEWSIHRTEVHNVRRADIDHLEPGEFEGLVANADSPQALADGLDWSFSRTVRAMSIYGLADVVGPSDVDLSDINEVDVPALDETTDDEDDADVEDRGPEADDSASAPPPGQNGAADGAVGWTDYNASTAAKRTCQNCGAHVDKQFAKVFEPDEEGAPRVCPNCEDMTRDADGTIREKRNGGHSTTGGSR